MDNLPRNKSQAQAGKDVPVGQVGREGVIKGEAR